MVGSDIEGMALLDEHTLLIVSDNDFGCEGKQTRFFRITFGTALHLKARPYSNRSEGICQ